MEDNSNLQNESQQASPISDAGDGDGAVGIIYKITCLVNGKIYVGQTRRPLEVRISEHKRNVSKGASAIESAIQIYDWENFIVEVLEVCPVKMLNSRERFHIRELKSKAPDGYNLTDGGEGLVNPSAETRAKMSANHPDISGERNPNYGKKTPPETCAKISAANKGKTKGKKRKPFSEKHKANISANHADVSGEKNPNYGKKPSPETLAKMSEAKMGENNPNYGKPRPPETCAKISAANKGKPSHLKGKKRAPETIAKIKATWARKKSS